MSHSERAAYAAILQRALDRRGETGASLSRAIGVSQAAVSQYRQGKYLPEIPVATRMADHLLDARVLETVVRLRTVTCQICGRATHRSRGTARKFCSRDCQLLAHKGLTRRWQVDPRDAAIAQMCRACEPEGICRTADCPLRGFSPLPFVSLRVA